jgi:hypothetical protein
LIFITLIKISPTLFINGEDVAPVIANITASYHVFSLKPNAFANTASWGLAFRHILGE